MGKVAKIKSFHRLKGFRDILPSDQAYWDHIIACAHNAAETFQYMRIRLPILEERSLFERSIGSETDIVSKEIFAFSDPGGREVALRPEFTAGMVRAFIEHGMWSQPQPVRLYEIGPVFRHDNPQAGRYRQFWQLDFEVFGESNPVVDAQVVKTAFVFFSMLPLAVVIKINSVGCRVCREPYTQALIQNLKNQKNKLCEDCQRRLTKNPLRILDCKQETCQVISREAPQVIDHLCDQCKAHFMATLEYLDDFEVPYELDPRLVRGLDYYSRTAFECVPVGAGDARQQALAGGGRYDYLIEDIGGRSTPAIGFAVGIDRIVEAMKEAGVGLPQPKQPEVFVAQLGTEARKAAYRLYDDLLRARISAVENFSKSGLKSQLEQANRVGVSLTLIMGQKEIADKTVIVRDMESGIQEIVDRDKIVFEVQKRLKAKRGETHHQDMLSKH